jgi:hypothetical protein
MTELSAFSITKKWPARHPDRIQRPAVQRGLEIPKKEAR